MKYGGLVAASVLTVTLTLSCSVFAQKSTWCGKHYMSNQTVVPPGGQFQIPTTGDEPLLAFRCSPTFRPYLEEDAGDVSFIIDAPIVYQNIRDASPITLSSSGGGSSSLGTVEITISVGSTVIGKKIVPLNTTGFEVSVDVSSLTPQQSPYSAACSAVYQSNVSSLALPQYFVSDASLLYLPSTPGSVVKTDLRTGTLLARPADGQGDFEPFVPQGFYISFEQHLVHNLSLINQLKADGFNTIHPIPPYHNATAFQQVLEKTAELGLYLVYDLRLDYQNLTAVSEQVEAYKSVPNLLLWETAHEPDGNSDPANATEQVYDLIYERDGYHPVSIVLNCQDYNFSSYVGGADIILEDAYPVGINATYSPVWHTPCTPDFGHCGCDNCDGRIGDVATRVQAFKDRLAVLGYDRSKTVWTTPQAFGGGAYWNTTPTGKQWASMGLTSLNHGATGSISFQYPTMTGNETTVEGTAVNLNPIITRTVRPFIVDAHVTRKTLDMEGVDVGMWYNGTSYLLMAASFESHPVLLRWSAMGLDVTNTTAQVERVISILQHTNDTGLISYTEGVGIYVVTAAVAPRAMSGGVPGRSVSKASLMASTLWWCGTMSGCRFL